SAHEPRRLGRLPGQERREGTGALRHPAAGHRRANQVEARVLAFEVPGAQLQARLAERAGPPLPDVAGRLVLPALLFLLSPDRGRGWVRGLHAAFDAPSPS